MKSTGVNNKMKDGWIPLLMLLLTRDFHAVTSHEVMKDFCRVLAIVHAV